MAASTSSPQAAKPRRPWRYSLRVLFVFFTLVCIVVWYWYRVPYREEVSHGKGQFLPAILNRGIYNVVKEVRHCRRLLRGEPIREGTTEYFDDQGYRLARESWREGKLHGEFVRWYPTSGKMWEKGEYRLGAKTGVWELFDPAENLVRRTPHDQNWPHGDAQWFDGERVARTVRYDHGEVTQIDGRDAFDPLGRALREGRIDHERIVQMLDKPGAKPPNIRLNEIADYISSVYNVPVQLDRRATQHADKSNVTLVTLDADRIKTQLMLVMLCDPHELAELEAARRGHFQRLNDVQPTFAKGRRR